MDQEELEEEIYGITTTVERLEELFGVTGTLIAELKDLLDKIRGGTLPKPAEIDYIRELRGRFNQILEETEDNLSLIGEDLDADWSFDE